MTITFTATAWAISGESFLWSYGTLSVAAGAGVWWRWRRTLGPRLRSTDARPDLGLYELAMLSGGPQLAITTAATQLHRDGLLVIDADGETLHVAGELEATADELERAAYEAVLRGPAMTADALREELAASAPLEAMREELTSAGLLLDDDRVARLRRLWLVGALLTLLGAIRVAAGLHNDAPVDDLALMVFGVGWVTFRLARRRPLATRRGRDVVGDWREECEQLRTHPTAGESALTAALFGGAALWLADPVIASAFGVPREDGHGWRSEAGRCSAGGGGGCGGGGCGGGCGGCGGCGG